MTAARQTPQRIDLLLRCDSARFFTAVILLPPGEDCPYRAEEWVDTLVEVEDGQLELVSSAGTCIGFLPGDLLVLEGLAVRALRSAGPSPTVLVTIRRSSR